MVAGENPVMAEWIVIAILVIFVGFEYMKQNTDKKILAELKRIRSMLTEVLERLPPQEPTSFKIEQKRETQIAD
jgi:hypothetical protein